MTDEIVTVAQFPNTASAELARNNLERAGIRAVYFQSKFTLSANDVQLQVAAVDAERALAVLAGTGNHAKHHAKHAHHGAGQLNADSTAGENPAEVVEGLTPREKAADRAFFAALVGMALPPLAIYVVWQLATVIVSRDRLSRRKRYRAIEAGLINLVVVALFVMWLRSF